MDKEIAAALALQKAQAMASKTDAQPSSTPSPTADTSSAPRPPLSEIPNELPARPAPAHQGNAFSRIFSRHSTQHGDIEIAIQLRDTHSQPNLEEMYEQRRQKRNLMSWSIKMSVVLGIVIAFWIWAMVWSMGKFDH